MLSKSFKIIINTCIIIHGCLKIWSFSCHVQFCVKWNTRREISYLHTLMIFPVHPYLNLMWLWSSCSMRSSLPYLEFLPSHWGNSILWPIPPLIRSDGITHDIIAWKFNIGLILMLMKMELTMNWQSQVKLQLFI